MLATRRRVHRSALAADAAGVTVPSPTVPGPATPPARLDRSFRTVQDAAAALHERVLERLFAAYPNARNELHHAALPDPGQVIEAVALVVAHRLDPAAARERLRALGRRYAAQGLRPPHYRLICELLVRAIADLCPGEWDAALECEWTSSLHLGAAAMIEGAHGPTAPAS